jgi:phospholipid/cholesterol/gamma-HCH transport system ATP-binding protein
VASVVVLSITRELGPCWRADGGGAHRRAFAAEIGTMRVTDQIDALTTLSTDPMKYLVAPRILAATLALPLLVVVADILGVMGGWLVGTTQLGFGSGAYLKATFDFPAALGRALGAGEGGGVRLRRHADGLLVRLPFGRRRAGRRAGDDLRRGVGLHPHPAFDYALTRCSSRDERHAQDPPARPVQELRAQGGADGVDLDIRAGHSMVILGGSGSGKSVTLKCILGLIRPDAGTIEVDGRDVLRMGAREREELNDRIGMLFQNGALFDSLPVWENVCFKLLAQRRITPRRARQGGGGAGAGRPRAASATSRRAELSGGMQKRVGLARAIAASPTSSSSTSRPRPRPHHGRGDRRADRGLREAARRHGVSITHDMASARRIGDDAAMIHKGRIVWTRPAATLGETGNAMVDQFARGEREGPIQMELRK